MSKGSLPGIDPQQYNVQIQLFQLLSNLHAHYFGELEILMADRLVFLRGTRRENGSVTVHTYRFEKLDNGTLEPFEPSTLHWEQRKLWMQKLYKAKQTTEQVKLFLDLTQRAIERDSDC